MKRRKIKWNVIVYYARKVISKFGYICGGAFIALMLEGGFAWDLLFGAFEGLVLGVIGTLCNEKGE